MKIKKRTLKFAAAIIILLITGYFAYSYFQQPVYQFKDSTLVYSQNRGQPDFTLNLKQKNETFDVYKVIYQSRPFLEQETKIYGLLFLPKMSEKVPGLVLLPGGGVTKEAESNLAAKIASWGYAVLTIDQRGLGETGGSYLNFEQDYQVTAQGKEPVQHLSVYDALAAFDVLRKVKEIDQNNIALAGESMGGRYALIATAVDDRIKGFIGISTAGFHFKNDGSEYALYLTSIDPDHYASKISPRLFFMLHGTDDSMVAPENARITFNLAQEPKKFFLAEGCDHGYCQKMENELQNDLQTMFKS